MDKNWFRKAADELTKKGKEALKDTVNSGMDEVKKNFPPEAIEQVANSVYGILDNPEIANKISEAVRSIDGDKIGSALEKVTVPLTTEENSIQLARILKQLNETGQLDSMMDSLNNRMDTLSGPQQFAIKYLTSGLEPILKDVGSVSEEELAVEIRESFSNLPTNDLTDMIEGLSRNITPETIGMLTNRVLDTLPAPKTLANTFSDILEVGLKRAENALADEPKPTTGSLTEEISKVIDVNLQKDANAKTQFDATPVKPTKRPKKGGKFGNGNGA